MQVQAAATERDEAQQAPDDGSMQARSDAQAELLAEVSMQASLLSELSSASETSAADDMVEAAIAEMLTRRMRRARQDQQLQAGGLARGVQTEEHLSHALQSRSVDRPDAHYGMQQPSQPHLAPQPPPMRQSAAQSSAEHAQPAAMPAPAASAPGRRSARRDSGAQAAEVPSPPQMRSDGVQVAMQSGAAAQSVADVTPSRRQASQVGTGITFAAQASNLHTLQ